MGKRLIVLLLSVVISIGLLFQVNIVGNKKVNEKSYSTLKSKLLASEKEVKTIDGDDYDSIFQEMQQMLNEMNNDNGDRNNILNTKQYCLLDPNGPTPTILMSLGRSGSGSTWQIMGNLTGQETPSTEYTGSSTKKSEHFFEEVGIEENPGSWLMEYLCHLQKIFKTSGIVGFKWKPYSTMFSDAAIAALHLIGNSVNPAIRVVRLRRNLLDVVISRTKHSLAKMPAHCMVGDEECLKQHAAALELPTHNLLSQLEELNRIEDAVDQLLVKFNVLHVHVSFEKLYNSDHDNVQEWLKVLQFLDVGDTHLTKEKLMGSMRHAGTSNTKQSDTITNMENVRKILAGTIFENLIH